MNALSQARSGRTADVVVAGLGGMGSAAAYHLARHGLRVIGLERFVPGHRRCASAAGTRAFRMAYFQDDAYVALAKRSEQLWQELDGGTGQLFDQVGGLLIAAQDHPVVEGVRASGARHGLEIRVLDSGELAERAPDLSIGEGEVCLLEARAGLLRSLACDARHRHGAVQAGAQLRPRSAVLGVRATEGGVQVETDEGPIDAGWLVVSTGAWAAGGLDGLGAPPLTILRQVQVDVQVQGPRWARAGVWNLLPPTAAHSFYGNGGGDGVLTVGQHLGGRPSHADDQEPAGAEELRGVEAFVAERVRGAGRVVARRVGRYACTPDQAPLIGPHPEHARVLVAGGFSGHGYKFVAAVGEVLAELVDTGRSRIPLESFSPARFGERAAGGPS